MESSSDAVAVRRRGDGATGRPVSGPPSRDHGGAAAATSIKCGAGYCGGATTNTAAAAATAAAADHDVEKEKAQKTPALGPARAMDDSSREGMEPGGKCWKKPRAVRKPRRRPSSTSQPFSYPLPYPLPLPFQLSLAVQVSVPLATEQ